MKRMMAFLLAAVLVMSLLSGCGGGGNLEDKTTTEAPKETQGDVEGTQGETEGEETTEAPKIVIEYPLKDAGKLTWYVQTGIDLHADYVEPAESPVHQTIITETGVEIEWQMVPVGANADTDFNLRLQEDPLPNVITGDNIRYDELFAEDLIYDLTPYLEEYAPDYWAYLNSDPTILKQVSLIGGEVVSFVCGVEELNTCSVGPMIRKDWLDECGLEIPYTLDEWETVLKAFRDKYGIAPLGMAKGNFYPLFALASGTGAHGGINLNFYVEDGKIKCSQQDEELRDIIAILSRWYAEGLIDPDVFTVNKSGFLPKAAQGQVGIAICDEAHSSRIPLETKKAEDAAGLPNTAEWVPIPYPVPNKGDAPVYTRYEGMAIGRATVITTSCSEEELITAIKMLNFGYTEYGKLVYNLGQEGLSWEYDANGENPHLTDLVINDPNGKTNAINKYSPMNDTVCPSIKMNLFAEQRYEQVTIDAFEAWGGNTRMKEFYVSNLRYTLDEKQERSDKVSALENYVKPFLSKCITGEYDIMAEWDNFLAELESLGIQDVIDLTQTAYDRMMD